MLGMIPTLTRSKDEILRKAMKGDADWMNVNVVQASWSAHPVLQLSQLKS